MKRKKLTALLLAATMTIAMAVPAMADPYVPSVTAKAAPTVVSAVFTSVHGTDLSNLGDGDLIVTSLADADDEATDEEIATRLNDAFDTLDEVDSLSELDVADDLQSVLDEINEENGYAYTLDDLTVKDLFDVTVDGDVADVLEDGDTIAVTFELELEDNCLLVMQYADGTWVVLTSDQYTINGDGTVTVYLTELGTLALIVPETADGGSGTAGTEGTEGTEDTTDAEEETTEAEEAEEETTETTDDSTSPQTGESMNYALIAMAVVLGFGAAVCFTTGKKRA